MSSDSDSELFFDAEENTPIHGSKKRSNSEPNVSIIHEKDDSKKPALQPPPTTNQEDTFIAPKPLQGGRRKFKELRQKLQNDDEDLQTTNLTPPNSQTSSIEGVYASSNKTSHPFKVIEVDTLSLQSFSSGRRLIGQSDLNSQLILENRKTASASALSVSSHSSSTHSSKDTSKYPSTITLATITAEASNQESLRCLPLQEPDVIASTKPCLQRNNGVDVNNSPKIDIPVAPPRRKKKIKPATSSLPITDFQPSTSTNVFAYPELVSPATTIETLTRELEHSLDCLPIGKSDKLPNSSDSSKCSTIKSVHSLDIRQVTKGQFVVKPQDNDKAKAETSPIKELSVEPEKVDNNSPRGSTNRNSVGHYSLGPHRSAHPQRSSKERRKSAGDENMFKFPDVNYRNLVNSDKPLTDLEILQQVTVLNLDTGERIPLSVAEDKLPQCLNPLSLHIMRLTSEYVSSSSMEKDKESDDESIIGKKIELPLCDENDAEIGGGMRRRTAKLKRFLGSTVKRTMHKAKSIAQEVSHARDRHREDIGEVVDEMHLGDQNIKLKAANSHKGPYDFEKVIHVQELNNEHEGPIWCMKFSACGRLLATAGQDKVLRIWVIIDAFQFFQDMRTKYNAEKVSPTPSQESLVSHHSAESPYLNFDMNSEEASKYVFMPKPFCTYYGHTSDLLDVSWSKNYFILSSSMDKTVRLWHISRKECLCCFQHIDFVTAIVFHPRDDRYFLSGSLDGKIRLWNIPDKKVAVWNEIEGTTKLITAANFCQNGKFAVIGSYDGRCIFYNTDQLKYHTQIHVRSTRGRNSTGRKISGIEPMPGEDKILVTSNDSRIRLYDLRDLSLSCKYKGYVNVSSQIKASFSHDGKYIVSGSENRDIYIWKTNHDYSKFTSVRRDRNVFWEAIKAHNVTVTCAIFAPNPDNIIKMVEDKTAGQDQTEHEEKEEDPMVEQRVKGCGGYVLISADFNGCIKIFMNKMKPKHSSLPASALV